MSSPRASPGAERRGGGRRGGDGATTTIEVVARRRPLGAATAIAIALAPSEPGDSPRRARPRSGARDARGGSRSWSAERFSCVGQLSVAVAPRPRGVRALIAPRRAPPSSGRARRRRARPARPSPRRGGEGRARGRAGSERRRPARGRPARRSVPSSLVIGRARRSSIAEARVAPGASVRCDARAARAARPRRRLDAGRGRRPRAGVRARRLEAPFAARARKGAESRAFPRRVGSGGKAWERGDEKRPPLGPRDRRGPRAKNVVPQAGLLFSRIRAGTGRGESPARAA